MDCLVWSCLLKALTTSVLQANRFGSKMKELFSLELLVEGAHCFLVVSQSLWPSCSKMKGLFSLELLLEDAHCQLLWLQNERIVQFGVTSQKRSLLLFTSAKLLQNEKIVQFGVAC